MGIQQFQPHRALEVLSPLRGSAYRIGGRLVLTAKHLVEGNGAIAQVRIKENPYTVNATIAWVAKDADIALLELPDEIAPIEPVLLGQLPQVNAGETTEFQMYGWPKWGTTLRSDGKRAAGGRQINGIIFIADKSPDGLLVIEPQRIPFGVASAGSHWEGMSGAAVICDGLIVAVQSAHHNPNRPQALEATPLSMINQDSQWLSLLGQHSIDPKLLTVCIANQRPKEVVTVRREATQEKLQQAVATEVHERLRQSIDKNVRLLVQMEQHDNQVQRPWSITLVDPSQKEILLEDSMTITQVFHNPDFSRQLLILGEPGVGKTTMLLELASELLQQAMTDVNEPIPVLIDLSSWSHPDEPFFEWLVDKLQEKYGRSFPADHWLTTNQLLPLLDGLDEVKPDLQQACAIAINAWLTGELGQRPCGVAICCRKEEYEKIVTQPLNLYGAIVLRPLSHSQIAEYLEQLHLETVWQDIQADADLLDFLSRPLFLSLFGLAQIEKTFSLDEWRRSDPEHQKDYLLDVYWAAAIKRELILDPREKQQGLLSKTFGTKKPPSIEQVKRSLVFAAKVLNQSEQREFLIERLQPTALPMSGQRIAFRILYGIVFTGIFVGAMASSALFSEWLPLMIFFSAPWLRYIFESGQIVPIERLQIKTRQALKKDRVPILASIHRISLFALVAIYYFASKVSVEFGLLMLAIFGTLAINLWSNWLIQGMRVEVDDPVKPNQGIWNTWQNALNFSVIVAGLVVAFGAIYVFKFTSYFQFQIPVELLLSFIVYSIGYGFFEGGGKALVQHCILRSLLLINHYAPIRFDRLLDYCNERLILQKVGGRYRFLHKSLQDYFAKMDLN